MNLKEIKDAARQAFSDQQSQDTEGGVPDAVSFIAGFVEGARHLQNAYETLNAHDEMLIATVKKMNLENEKLINALQFYAEYQNDNPDNEYNNELARQVLKEIGEE